MLFCQLSLITQKKPYPVSVKRNIVLPVDNPPDPSSSPEESLEKIPNKFVIP